MRDLPLHVVYFSKGSVLSSPQVYSAARNFEQTTMANPEPMFSITVTHAPVHQSAFHFLRVSLACPVYRRNLSPSLIIWPEMGLYNEAKFSPDLFQDSGELELCTYMCLHLYSSVFSYLRALLLLLSVFLLLLFIALS